MALRCWLLFVLYHTVVPDMDVMSDKPHAEINFMPLNIAENPHGKWNEEVKVDPGNRAPVAPALTDWKNVVDELTWPSSGEEDESHGAEMLRHFVPEMNAAVHHGGLETIQSAEWDLMHMEAGNPDSMLPNKNDKWDDGEGDFMPDSMQEWEEHVEHRLQKLHHHVDDNVSKLHQNMNGKLNWGQFEQSLNEKLRAIKDAQHKTVMELWEGLNKQHETMETALKQVTERSNEERKEMRQQLAAVREEIQQLKAGQSSIGSWPLLMVIVVIMIFVIRSMTQSKPKRSVL